MRTSVRLPRQRECRGSGRNRGARRVKGRGRPDAILSLRPFFIKKGETGFEPAKQRSKRNEVEYARAKSREWSEAKRQSCLSDHFSKNGPDRSAPAKRRSKRRAGGAREGRQPRKIRRLTTS